MPFRIGFVANHVFAIFILLDYNCKSLIKMNS